VQGQLRKGRISFTVRTECAHCARPIRIEIDSDLRYHVGDEESRPLVFSPRVNFAKITEPSIIDVF